MREFCDLHTHSVFSDGTCTPTELIEKGEKIGLSAIALTDHNTVAGLPEFLAAAKGKKIVPVPGVEISTDYNGTELHVLGLFLPEKAFGAVTEFVNAYNRRKEKSNEELISSLQAAGYRVDLAEIKAETPNGHVNRAHIAATLVKKGYIGSVQEGFSGLLSEKAGYYKPPKRQTAFETIAFLRSLGAVPVLAHPFLNLTAEELCEFLEEAKGYGLVGMETVYSRYSDETAKKAAEIALQYALKESGGSDYHGENKPDIDLGIGTGNLKIPSRFFEELRLQ